MFIILGGWLLLAIIYMELLRSNIAISAGILLFISEVGLDLLIAFFAYQLSRNCLKIYKKALLFFSAAYLVESFTDGFLNTSVHILFHNPLSMIEELSIEIPFFIFLSLQFLGWYQVFSVCKNTPRNIYSWIIITPFMLVGLILLYLFGLAYNLQTHISYFSLGLLQIIAVILNLANFAMSALCLSTAKHKAISYMAMGTLILTAKDMIERFTILSETYYVFSDIRIVWVLGLAIFAYGLFLARKENIFKKEGFCLSSLKSLQSLYTFWCFTIFIFSFLVFSFSLYFFSYLKNVYLNESLAYISSSVMFYSIVTIVFSNFFASKMLTSFKTVKYLIDSFKSHPLEEIGLPKNFIKSDVTEFSELEDCLVTAKLAVSDKFQAEKQLSVVTAQVTHDIRSPLSALEMTLADIAVPEEKRIIMRNSIGRIRDIINNLANYSIDKDKKDSEVFVPYSR